MASSTTSLAESIGRRVLEWKGSEFIEFVYLLDEKNAIRIHSLITSMAEDDQNILIDYCERAQTENGGLRIDGSCLRYDQE
jgi:hypothetical protein